MGRTSFLMPEQQRQSIDFELRREKQWWRQRLIGSQVGLLT